MLGFKEVLVRLPRFRFVLHRSREFANLAEAEKSLAISSLMAKAIILQELKHNFHDYIFHYYVALLLMKI